MPNSRRDYKLYFLDIASSCKKISSYIRGLTFEKFSSEPKTIDAVVRNLEIIGEFDVNIPIIWETVKDDIPSLEKQIKKVLKELGSRQLKLT